jgi:hypothetical protein
MDLTDASAMTEASGLTDDPTAESTSAHDTERTKLRPPEAQAAAGRLLDKLRQETMAAPLQSLLVAFLIGVLVSRRGR